MKALTFGGQETVHYESVPDPIIEEPTDVIVKIHLTAICGSDLHVYHQREKGLDQGTTMGHEFVGEIVEMGGEVKAFKTGDIVFSPFTTNCSRCYYCRKNLTSLCKEGLLFGWVQNGKGLQGVQAEYARVPLADSTLLRLPGNVVPEEGLLLCDCFSTGYFCAEMAEIRPGGVYAVVGCGPIGLMAIVATRDLGGEQVYGIDAIPHRLLLGQEFGAIPINYEEDDPAEILRALTGGRGADAVLEAVGNASAAKSAMNLVRPGGIIAVVGFHTDNQFSFTPVEAYHKHLTYKVGRCPAQHYMKRLLPLVQEKRYPLVSVISHRLPLSQGVRAYEIFDKKLEGCVKIVLEP